MKTYRVKVWQTYKVKQTATIEIEAESEEDAEREVNRWLDEDAEVGIDWSDGTWEALNAGIQTIEQSGRR